MTKNTINSIDLSLKGYQLADMNIYAVKDVVALNETDIDALLEEIENHKHEYNAKYIEKISSVQDEHDANEAFIRGLRKEFLDGKIKTDEGGKYYKPSPKTVSLKAAINRVGREQGFAVGSIIDLSYNTTYEIPHGYGWSLSMGLSKISTEEGFNELLSHDKTIEAIEKIEIIIMAQRAHRLENNVTYQRFLEIKEFQEETDIILSTKIVLGKELEDDEINYLYDKLALVKEKHEEMNQLLEQVKERVL